MFHYVESPVFHSDKGTPYLKSAGVHLISRPEVELGSLESFFLGFSEDLKFNDYLDDTGIDDGAQLVKFAGQACYASFGPKRTKNTEAQKYLTHIKESSHGSTFEHANYSFFFYGVSRSLTHELVRHRAGFGFCLTGDTLIYSERHFKDRRNGPKKRKLSDIFAMKATSHGRSRLKLLKLRCLDENTRTFTTGRVRDVVFSGKKQVFKVVLADGKTISSTADHRFLTEEGWKPLKDIVGGLSISAGGLAVAGALEARIYVNGIQAYKDKEWLEDRYLRQGLSQESIALEAGISKHTLRAWIRRNGLQKPAGSWTIGVSPWNKGRTYVGGWHHSEQTKQFLSDHKMGAKNPAWKGGTTRGAVQVRRETQKLARSIMERDNFCCRLCLERVGHGPKRPTMHHILPIWARPDLAAASSNLVTLCWKCHSTKVNGHELEYVELFGRAVSEIPPEAKPSKGCGNLMLPRLVKIQAITNAGVKDTYDIEMEGEHHNFVANGIVTHNSQLSQRYVSGSVLRFVERPEYQNDFLLHAKFLERIDRAKQEYEDVASILFEKQVSGDLSLSADRKTDLRKKVQQTARSVLPNETETFLVVTANARAWRHFCEMRGEAFAETEIRGLALSVHTCLNKESPLLFGDYEVKEEVDGIRGLKTEYRKI